MELHDFFVVHEFVLHNVHEVEKKREKIERAGFVARHGAFQGELRTGDYGFLI